MMLDTFPLEKNLCSDPSPTDFYLFIYFCDGCMNSMYILCNNPLSDIVCEHFSPIL